MCSYNEINGIYASENHWLLTEVLRDDWSFEGLVVSDLVLFFIGMPSYYEVEGDDRIKLSFPFYMSRLATHVCRFNKNTYHILVGALSTDIRLSADCVLDWDDGYTMLREKWDNDTQFIMA